MNPIFRLFVVGWVLMSCAPQRPPLFALRPPETTGIDFTNQIEESDTLNLMKSTNMYNGAGVAMGDLNGDQLTDVILAGNMVPSRLFLNRGELQFEEATEAAGLLSQHWVTGISLVDVNADGWLDVYFSCSITASVGGRTNQLYLNQGCEPGAVPRFREVARQAGLADTAFTTHTAFFDYDLDGDLDAYCLTNATEGFPHNTLRPKKTDGSGLSNDRLYRNEGLNEAGIPVFTNVTLEAGITLEGYGLGIAITDINRDGWPDVYLSNDFITNDVLYVNQRDGTFRNEIAAYLKHQSHNGMGVDIADVDHNGWEDILVVDMLPEGHEDLKLMQVPGNYDRHWMQTDGLGYQPQFVRNTLQANQGQGQFSEVGQMSGIDQTHWSWAPLIMDMDNDGLRDVYITNGYPKNVIDLDYVNFVSTKGMFGSAEAMREKQARRLDSLEEIRLPNYAYQNQGDLRFAQQTQAWGFGQASVSNGAAYGDLDGDGDLDLIVSNLNHPAFVYENRTDQQFPHRHYLRVKFAGKAPNTQGLGARLTLWAGEKPLVYQHFPYRGFQSFVEPIAHFGLDSLTRVDSLQVIWPNGHQQKLHDVSANQVLELRQAAATASPLNQPSTAADPLLVPAEVALPYRHEESNFVDFRHSPLLPHQHTCAGPGMGVADVNGDGRDDLYLSGASGQAGSLLLQTAEGDFTAQPFPADTLLEETGCLLFDADQDGDADLYVVSGGTEFGKSSPNYQDRLYLNDGQGHFSHAPEALPPIQSSGSSVVAADYDRDGDLDLFVGGRVVPMAYPTLPKSYLLENEGGRFRDITDVKLEGGHQQGMITAALWTDANGDGWVDLLLAGEWMPLTLLLNRQGRLEQQKVAAFSQASGWWNSLHPLDYDKDGDMDYVAGNLGLNSRYQASIDQPVRLYGKDFDQNGTIDPVMTYYVQGKEQIAHARAALNNQILAMKKRFTHYADFAKADFEEVFYDRELEGARIFEAHAFASSLVENLGEGNFALHPLPRAAQLAPIQGIQSRDFNQDGWLDLLLVGNFYPAAIELGPYDAFKGLMLLGSAEGDFTPLSFTESGFLVDGDARALVEVSTDQGFLMVASQNDDGLKAWTDPASTNFLWLSLQPLDTRVQVRTRSGEVQLYETTYGGGYLSQASRVLRLPPGTQSVEIHDSQGRARTIHREDLLP